MSLMEKGWKAVVNNFPLGIDLIYNFGVRWLRKAPWLNTKELFLSTLMLSLNSLKVRLVG